MKNIHILPTDKPSRLGKFIDTNNLFLRTSNDIPRGENVYIYITSDEEIKEGDWGWYHKDKISQAFGKIILTTDQDLIADGVQCIDDEFLEWFVKNPSCEEVEVESNYRVKSGTIQEHNEGKAGYEYYEYKIIIPKEEPKQIKCYCGHTTYCDCGPLEEPKQETLEEASQYYAHNYFDMHETNNYKALKQGFEAGAKWQQERMLKFILDEDNHTEGELGNSCIDVQTLVHFIEQNKKKQ